MREKITFMVTVVVYVLFHLRLGTDLRSTCNGTLYQVMLTAPYALGFTYITAIVFKRLSGTATLPWNRLVRIYCTIGILFAFFFALYEYAERGQQPAEVLGRRLSAEQTAGRVVT